MANSKYDLLEIRIVLDDPTLTHLYVRCGPASDGMIGIEGWYHKVIPGDAVATDVMMDALVKQSYLTEWDRGAPRS